MRPLIELGPEEARTLQGLFFDLDDTFLNEGHLTEAAYSRLFRLRESGLTLIPLTGRPAVWGELTARMWPVSAAIAENGALAYFMERGRLRSFDTAPAEERARRREALRLVVEEIRSALPELIPADDVRGRISDFTFDVGEHERPSEALIERAIAIARTHGARVARSSVHLHVGFDPIDKTTGALAFLRSRGVDPTLALGRFAFIGDSENDASCFAAFRTTLGVRNLRGRFSLLPRYVTRAERELGFIEAADHLCALRR